MHFSSWVIAGVLGCATAQADVLAGSGVTLFAHPEADWWLSGQVNGIWQGHLPFSSPYQGVNSLRPYAEGRASYVATLFAGYRVTPTTELQLDVEAAGGNGISDALGIAGFTSLDVVRNPTLGRLPYVARALIHQTVPLSDQEVEVRRDPLHLAGKVPARRLELRAGKFGTADFFDTNAYGSDSHAQFLNWSVDNNGAYDYAADTRGYTLGAIVEYEQPEFGVLFGELLMPTVANGIDHDFDLAHAHSENLEVDVRQGWLPGRTGVVRLLGFVNHAAMGSYREALDAHAAGEPADITAHRQKGRSKYGVGLNVEQQVGGPVAAFGRLGWNDGRNESYAYTEIDNTAEVGLHVDAAAWQRPLDGVGLAFTSNGLSAGHRDYLAAGGAGFILGDGRLRYAREDIVEAFYNLSVGWGLFAGLDAQFVAHPGFNADRGPVWVGAGRLHLEL